MFANAYSLQTKSLERVSKQWVRLGERRHFMLNETQAITVFAVYTQGNTNVNQTFVMVLLDMGKNNCQKLQRG